MVPKMITRMLTTKKCMSELFLFFQLGLNEQLRRFFGKS
jgi:hypothetical protein